MNVMSLPCAQIKPDRQGAGYATQDVLDLAESIRRNGLLRPILVRKADDGYVIVHGERRWRAVRELGHATISAWLVLDTHEHPAASAETHGSDRRVALARSTRTVDEPADSPAA